MQVLPRPEPARAGFSLVDVCVAMAILAIALGTLVGSVFWAMRLEEVNEETAAANQHVRAMLEGMNEMPIEQVYAAYNADAGDNPDKARDYFAELAVEDPLLVVGKKTDPTVSVSFPQDPENELLENRLTIALRLDWEGASGPRTVEMSTLLRNR